MRITKSRLLQIIREEVELHEKKLEENTFELDESDAMDLAADKNNDGEISNSEAKKIFNHEKENDEEVGNLEEVDLEECGMEEDALYSEEPPHKMIMPKQHSRLEIKIKK